MYGTGAATGPYMPPAAMPTYAPLTVIGMVIALCGSTVMIAGSFAPWLGHLTSTLSGWDIFDSTSLTGDNPFIIWSMFARFDPFVTGLTTVLIGALAGLLAVMILVAPKKALPSRFYIPYGLHFLLVMILVIGIFALIPTVMTALSGDATRSGWHIENGLWIVVLGFIATIVGLAMESQRPAVRQVPAPPSPGWPS
jgi:small-conductance mechanosensitive channel